MCGIVGLFFKNFELKPKLGTYLGEMLAKMSDRGPDSAGLALYTELEGFDMKLTLQFEKSGFAEEIKLLFETNFLKKFILEYWRNHAVIKFFAIDYNLVVSLLSRLTNQPKILSKGSSIEIFKEAGSPAEFVKRFEIWNFTGTHGIGHTRMATESAVTTMGAHPFSTGADQCLVHNGSLSNHNSVRRKLLNEGIKFETENDSEVAAAYISHKMMTGSSLQNALEKSLYELDGFFTFLVGTKEGFGVLRDKIACKPAVLAETDDYVAFGSEYRALTSLPDIEKARVWEPEPARVYFWEYGRENI